MADAHRITQLIYNLVTNAIKFFGGKKVAGGFVFELKPCGVFSGTFWGAWKNMHVCWWLLLISSDSVNLKSINISNLHWKPSSWTSALNPSKGSKGLDQKTFTVDENPWGRRSPTFTIPKWCTKKGWISRKEKMSLKRKPETVLFFSSRFGAWKFGKWIKGNKCWHKDLTNHFSLVTFARFHPLFSASSPQKKLEPKIQGKVPYNFQ